MAKRRWASLAAALVALLALRTLEVPADARGATCAYVVGTIEGRAVTTPAIPIIVPDSEAHVDAIRVHVDATTWTILVYTVSTPEIDAEKFETDVFVSVTSDAPPHNYSDTNVEMSTCVHFEASTSAVPVYIPASALETPGTVFSTPSVILTHGNQQVKVRGEVIRVGGRQIVVPEYESEVPAHYVSSPSLNLTFDLDGVTSQAAYLMPPD